MRCGIAGHIVAVPFCFADGVDRRGSGNVGGVITPAGQRQYSQVAFDRHHLGDRRNPSEAQPRRDFPFVHDAVVGEALLFRMLNDQQVERPRIA